MYKVFRVLCFFLIVWLQGSIEALILRQQFAEAETGDYLVAMQGKNATLLHIFKKEKDSLIIEEITVPIKNRPSSLSWQEWLSQNAPQHTCWVIYEINLGTGKMSGYYSFTEKGWLDLRQGDHFLSTLLMLQLQQIPSMDRKKVGPQPQAGYLDRRAVWNPPLIFEGKKHPEVSFNAWHTIWPQDGSELAGKWIDLYLPKDKGSFLNYFPYWVEIQGAGNQAKLRIIDSGRHMVSPKAGLPAKK